MKKMLVLLAALLFGLPAFAQLPSEIVSWSVELRSEGGDAYELLFTGTVKEGWHTYGVGSEYSAPVLTIETASVHPEGDLYNLTEAEMEDDDPVFYGRFQLGQKLRCSGGEEIRGFLTYMACTGGMCTPPVDWAFSVTPAPADGKRSAIEDPSASGPVSLWALILEAILWGFAMLLTPCVFPMIPMTVSFFLKGASTAAAGRFRAFAYGLFIVLLYTVPVSLIIMATRWLGGDAVTADIFNWLATHWLPNLLFFAVFMLFAASFFGAFEIVLPSSLVNKSDKNAEKGGLAGIFFMALTLVLVSFSCTGPIVGSVLIRSTSGEFWTPMVTMLAFSLAFALPFTLFALFPSLLKKIRGKSGDWLGSVKVVLGFVEVALGFKFLSVADQTYHWGLLDREVYLAIWIVVFSLLGLYLLGKIKFPSDSPEQKPLSVFRLSLVIAVFSFVVYMIPGMWGAPLKALSGYLPPLNSQDFVLGSREAGPELRETTLSDAASGRYGIQMPLGLRGYFTLEEGLAASAREGKPVFVDITGHGCVNCREMEQRVWSDPKVLPLLRDRFVLVALYTDDKTKLPREEWITLPNGRELKDLGRVNSYIVRERFGVNAQPNYALLDSDGSLLAPLRGYDLDVDAFAAFLQSGLDAFGK